MKMAEVGHFDGKREYAACRYFRGDFFAFFPSEPVHSPCF
ncbi:hypothetical protein NEILACOT_04015 [Neisseria lactamica ATCC 23970]|uniref:Uncharacterized protein n=1 Tax=Neisseria lactamica ATCC 23970 TaxID=546265 RepID=D0W910_NEILA|nr:hypothetical protein NEILACOT_04015 [Neisseria lactamica ATCC 23970]